MEKFGATHSLTADELQSLKAEVTRRFLSIAQAVNGAPTAAAAKEPLFEIPVGFDDGRVVPLRLFEGDNLVRAVQQFAKEQNIPEDVIPSLFEEVKKRVFPNDADTQAQAPTQSPDLIFDIPIEVDGEVKRLKLHRGDVLGDRVKAFAAEHGLADEVAGKMLEAVAERIRATQEAERAAEARRAQVQQQQQQQQQQQRPAQPLYEFPIEVDGTVFPLRLYEGDVLKSAVEAFVAQHGFDVSTVPVLVDQVAARLTPPQQQQQQQQVPREPLLSLAVALDNPNPDTAPLPPIDLYQGESPQAVAEAYCQRHGLDVAAVAPQLAQVLAARLEQMAAAAAGATSQ